MKYFDEQLLRLKQAVKLTDDQDVAALLGMTKAAFSGRKKRGAFPEDKLFALATRRPDLHLDVLHILAGNKKDVAIQLTLAELEAALAYGADKGGSIAEQMSRAAALVEAMHAPLPPDEQALLETYRRCTPKARAHLVQTAALLSAGMPAPAAAPAAPTRKTKNTISIGTLHGQSIEGGMTNHGPMTFGVSPPGKTRKPSKS